MSILISAAHFLRKISDRILRRNRTEAVWIDVGAYHGELTLPYALQNPLLKIYAIEPNLQAAAKLIGASPNYFVIPVALAESDGCADFHINAADMSSSLLPVNEEGAKSWVGLEHLRVERTVTVPTLRLDTLMALLGIAEVEFLKIDAQGMDLAILRSAGTRLQDIRKVQLEVEVASTHYYAGTHSKDEVLTFMGTAGFTLIETVKQTHDQEENLTFVRKP